MSFCSQCGQELPDNAKFCANCGAATGAAVSAMPHDRAEAPAAAPLDRPVLPTPPPRDGLERPIVQGSRGGAGWILPALVAVAVVIIGYLLLVPKTTAPAVEGRDAAAVADDARGTSRGVPTERRAVDEASDAATMAGANTRASDSVSAAVLDSAFNRDPAGAAERYAGPIRVSGTIATMVQPGATPSLSMEGRTRFNYMIVEFPEGYRTRLAPLSKGQFITVACDQVRELGGTTILRNCLLT